MLDAAISRAHNRAERTFPLEDVTTGFVQNVRCSIAEQTFGGSIPEADFSLQRDDKRRIRRAFEQPVYVSSKHLRRWHVRIPLLWKNQEQLLRAVSSHRDFTIASHPRLALQP